MNRDKSIILFFLVTVLLLFVCEKSNAQYYWFTFSVSVGDEDFKDPEAFYHSCPPGHFGFWVGYNSSYESENMYLYLKNGHCSSNEYHQSVSYPGHRGGYLCAHNTSYIHWEASSTIVFSIDDGRGKYVILEVSGYQGEGHLDIGYNRGSFEAFYSGNDSGHRLIVN